MLHAAQRHGMITYLTPWNRQLVVLLTKGAVEWISAKAGARGGACIAIDHLRLLT